MYRKKLNTDKIKDIDLIVYLRTHKNKNYTFQKKVLLYLLRDFKNLKILVFGSVFRDVNNKNFGKSFINELPEEPENSNATMATQADTI